MGDTHPKSLPPFLKNESQFEDDNADDTNNGLCLANIYIPEEVLLHILSYGNLKELLKYSLVCRKWNNLIKSNTLWSTIYKRKYNRKPKKLPWYLYYCLFSTNFFDTNLLLNGNGQDQFTNWVIMENGGNKCIIEDPPVGADPLPLDVPEFKSKTSCFTTSYHTCYKLQSIKLGQSQLFQHILDCYKPHIYLSEWTAGRFDCGCIYRLRCGFVGIEERIAKPCVEHRVNQWEGREWTKIEMTIQDYPEGIKGLTFEHEGCDTQFWAGHYGSKMAGGVVKLLFDSIEQLPADEYGNDIPKKFSKVQFHTNGVVVDEPEELQHYYDEQPPVVRRICRLPRRRR